MVRRWQQSLCGLVPEDLIQSIIRMTKSLHVISVCFTVIYGSVFSMKRYMSVAWPFVSHFYFAMSRKAWYILSYFSGICFVKLVYLHCPIIYRINYVIIFWLYMQLYMYNYSSFVCIFILNQNLVELSERNIFRSRSFTSRKKNWVLFTFRR